MAESKTSSKGTKANAKRPKKNTKNSAKGLASVRLPLALVAGDLNEFIDAGGRATLHDINDLLVIVLSLPGHNLGVKDGAIATDGEKAA